MFHVYNSAPPQLDTPVDVCQPTPCGSNSNCKELNGQAICSCLPEYSGSPPQCRPECVINAECAYNRACANRKCVDPCPGACGKNAECNVFNHYPICSCKQGFTGNSHYQCYPIPVARENQSLYRPDVFYAENSNNFYSKPHSAVESDTFVVNPCIPSPCGQYAQCNDQNGVAVCKCLPNYYGSAPNCRPECTVNSDCPNIKACVNERCVDPCPGACGLNTVCNVINHIPNCACRSGYEGDAFVRCQPIVVARKHRSKSRTSAYFNRS